MGKIQAYVMALEHALNYHGRDSWELTCYHNNLALVLIEYGQAASLFNEYDSLGSWLGPSLNRDGIYARIT